jgi:hypothetical protein
VRQRQEAPEGGLATGKYGSSYREVIAIVKHSLKTTKCSDCLYLPRFEGYLTVLDVAKNNV